MPIWDVAPNGELSARIDDLKVVIRRTTGFTRFLLMACQTSKAEGTELLLESGSEDDLRTAQDKAVMRALALARHRS